MYTNTDIASIKQRAVAQQTQLRQCNANASALVPPSNPLRISNLRDRIVDAKTQLAQCKPAGRQARYLRVLREFENRGEPNDAYIYFKSLFASHQGVTYPSRGISTNPPDNAFGGAAALKEFQDYHATANDTPTAKPNSFNIHSTRGNWSDSRGDYIQFDLTGAAGTHVPVDSVHLVQRLDGYPETWPRMRGCSVQLLDSDNKVVWSTTIGYTNGVVDPAGTPVASDLRWTVN